MPPKPLIAGNWKMNRGGADGMILAREIAARVDEVSGRADLLVCPPYVGLGNVAEVVSGTGVAVGGQDCHGQDSGAYTGDVSAPMLVAAGAGFVIVGHSERRNGHGETDAVVHGKAAAARRAGLVAIVCIGETEAERDRGETLEVLSRQVAGSIPNGAVAADTVIAYEPVWAIGTGRTPSPEEVAEAHAHIRAEIGAAMESSDAVRILYGGSVNPGNAVTLLAIDNVNGALVGGASLDADSFLAIASSVP